MAVSVEALRALASLFDRWQSAAALPTDAAANAIAQLQREAAAQGAEFAAAFEAMVQSASATTTATATAAGAAFTLSPLPEALRDAALADSLGGGSSSEASVPGAQTLQLDRPPPPRESGQHVGPYRLIRELGRGGMGVVWLAERADGQHNRQVALKMPLVENLNWLLAARFARERNILASLEHPSIARLYDAGVDEKTQPYIAIEYVQGQAITDYVREKKLKPEATAQLFIRVIEAVAHAHTQLVIHRDIKPSNILVDANGQPHLLDFGIAKLLDDEDSQGADATQLTRLSGRALTLDYASPEQINNASLGTASDVYSLGVVLYELLTGSRPYRPKGPTRRDLEQAILDQEPSKPSDQLLTATTGDSETGKSARRMRGDLDTVVLTALRKDPRQRYATAQAFADDLKHYLAFDPIAAKPDSQWYRVSKFVRRHRVAVAFGIALAASSVAGVVGVVWQANEARLERDEAQRHAIRAAAQNAFVDLMISEVGHRGQALTMRDFIDKGVAILERNYQNQPTLMADLLLPLAGRYSDLGLLDKEQAVMERAVSIALAQGDFAVKARVLCSMTDTEYEHGNAERALEYLAEGKRALKQVERRTQNVFATCLQAEAYLESKQGRVEHAIALYSAALDALALVQPPDIVSEASVLSGRASLYRGQNDLARAFADANDAIARLEKSGRATTMGSIIMRMHRVTLLSAWGELTPAARELELIASSMGDGGSVNITGYAQFKRAVVLGRIGASQSAEKLLQAAIRQATLDGDKVVAVVAQYELAHLLIQRSALDEAVALLAVVEAAWPTLTNTYERVPPVLLRAELAIARQDGAAAVVNAEAALTALEFPKRVDAPGLSTALRVAATAYAMAAQQELAERTATAAISVSERTARNPSASADVGESWLLMARLNFARQDMPAAATALSKAKAPLEVNFPVEHAFRREWRELDSASKK